MTAVLEPKLSYRTSIPREDIHRAFFASMVVRHVVVGMRRNE